MPRNGTGTYALPLPDVVTGTPISSSAYNTTSQDLAAALTGSLARDGQGAMTGNLPMGGNRITGMADGAAATDAATRQQVLAPPGNVTIAKTSPTLLLNKPASGTAAIVRGQTAGVNRWVLALGNEDAESTGDLGSNFRLNRHSDAGTFLDSPLAISRATGAVTVASPALWRTALGATATGAAVFTAASEGAARTALGVTTVGQAVFTAADEGAARTAMLAPARPTSSAGVPGDFRELSVGPSSSFNFPAGGTWAAAYSVFISGSFNQSVVFFGAGGALVVTTGATSAAGGFCWRIT